MKFSYLDVSVNMCFHNQIRYCPQAYQISSSSVVEKHFLVRVLRTFLYIELKNVSCPYTIIFVRNYNPSRLGSRQGVMLQLRAFEAEIRHGQTRKKTGSVREAD